MWLLEVGGGKSVYLLQHTEAQTERHEQCSICTMCDFGIMFRMLRLCPSVYNRYDPANSTFVRYYSLRVHDHVLRPDKTLLLFANSSAKGTPAVNSTDVGV